MVTERFSFRTSELALPEIVEVVAWSKQEGYLQRRQGYKVARGS